MADKDKPAEPPLKPQEIGPAEEAVAEIYEHRAERYHEWAKDVEREAQHIPGDPGRQAQLHYRAERLEHAAEEAEHNAEEVRRGRFHRFRRRRRSGEKRKPSLLDWFRF